MLNLDNIKYFLKSLDDHDTLLKLWESFPSLASPSPSISYIYLIWIDDRNDRVHRWAIKSKQILSWSHPEIWCSAFIFQMTTNSIGEIHGNWEISEIRVMQYEQFGSLRVSEFDQIFQDARVIDILPLLEGIERTRNIKVTLSK
ncbi:hypothetical protein HCG51_08825 [Tolypothrix sp. PCC 7910]|uniref:hypothetical protein n=1 Tax=Tolypothrix sp. PCC 7910 TaxID=2099387 RepID=UPI0014277BD8|nr:hypothetical protein [Tolypothrix sp. PCC 7910]QIR36833.1 hypothetical protein HCG51_08825 [Tolypothrix sp. PCC 7910]